MRWNLLVYTTIAGVLIPAASVSEATPPSSCPPLKDVPAVNRVLHAALNATSKPLDPNSPKPPITISSYYEMCKEQPALVACSGGGGGKLKLVEVEAIDARLRARFEYRSDVLTKGRPDYWMAPVACGDCFAEDEEFWCYAEDGSLVLRRIDQMTVGTKVLSYDWDKQEFCTETVTARVPKGVRRVKRVAFKNWGDMRVTEDHNMWSRDRQMTPGYSKRKLSEFSARHHHLIPFASFLNPAARDAGYFGLGEMRAKVCDTGEDVPVWDVTISRTATFVHKTGMLAHNCEDYALTLSEDLHAAGQGGQYMGIVVWYPPNGAHATLVVETADAGTVEVGVGTYETPSAVNWKWGTRVAMIWFDGKQKISAVPGWPAPVIKYGAVSLPKMTTTTDD